MIKRFLGNLVRALIRMRLLKSNTDPKRTEVQLKEILSKAKNVKAYRKNLEGYNDKFSDSEVMSYFKSLPILSKQDLKEDPDSFMSDHIKYIEVRTGGSTGEPLAFFQDKNSRNAQKRNMYFGRKQWGLNFDEDRCLLLWGHANSFAPGLKGLMQKISIDLKDFFLDRKRVSVYDLNAKSVAEIVESINKHDPHYIQGYASSLEILASLISDSGLKLKSDNLKLIVSTAEPLLETQKKIIENTFDCKIANEYGCTEIGVLAYSNSEGKMQTVEEGIFIETLNTFTKGSSLYGEIIVTTLGESSPILLRYNTGDIAKLEEINDIQYITSIDGRNHDQIKLNDGSIVHGELFTHVLENIDSIEKFQVHQTHFTHINITLKTNDNWSEAHNTLIKEKLNTVLNHRADINIFFDDFKFESSGKFRWIKSDV